ncbi:MAG: hypothetical protein KBD83_07830 [Gammaproteobacteria bacterium]|nr:hypothetical protein [Gammaproteobacteria bacterium]
MKTKAEFNELLLKLGACDDAVKWAYGKSWNEVFETCERGDWLLWLFKKTNPDDLRLLTLAKGHCAATVLHLMEDERSKTAVQAAIDYGNDEIGDKQLAAASYAASYAAYAAASYAASYAAVAAASASAAYAASYAAAVASASAAAYGTAAAIAAKKENQILTANIVRKYITIEKWNL